MQKLGLSIKEAAASIGISREKLYLEISAGNGPPIVHIGRRMLVPQEKLVSWFRGLSAKPRARERQVCELLQKHGKLSGYEIATALAINPSEIYAYLSYYVTRGILRPAGFSATPPDHPGSMKAKLYALGSEAAHTPAPDFPR